MRRALLAMLVCIVCIVAPGLVQGATRVCNPVGTSAAPADPATGANWVGGVAPGSSDIAVLSDACFFEQVANLSLQALQITHAAAGWRVRVGAAAAPVVLNLSTCNTTNAEDPGSPIECGATDGTFELDGTLIYDSRTDTVPLYSTFLASAISSGSATRFYWIADPAVPAFAVGDLVHVLSGPNANLVYEVSTGGCGSGVDCYFDFRLFDAETAYMANQPTAHITEILADGSGVSDWQSEAVRVGGLADAAYESAALASRVYLCRDNTGSASSCENSASLSADGQHSGWYLFPITSSRFGTSRYLIRNTYNDVASGITGDTGTWDMLEMVEPLPQTIASSTISANTQAMIHPGFAPLAGDEFVVYRPARVQYTGAEAGDGGLRFLDTNLAFQYYDFEDWAVIKLRDYGTSPIETAPSLELGRYIPWCAGNGVDETHNGHGQGYTGGGCNSHTVDLAHFASATVNHAAVVDARTPINTSTTCIGCTGTPGVPGDADTSSGHHGFHPVLAASPVAPTYTGVGCRYLGDDCFVLNIDAVAVPTTVAVTSLTCWYLDIGASGNCVDSGAAVPEAALHAAVSRVISVNHNGSACSPLLAMDGASSTLVSASLSEVFALEQIGAGAVLKNTEPPAGTLYDLSEGRLSSALVFGGGVDCVAANNASITRSWIEGYGSLANDGTTVAQSFLRAYGGAASNSIFGRTSATEPIEARGNVVINIGIPSSALSPVDGHAAMTVKNNALFYTAATTNVFGNYGTATMPFVTIEGNILRRASLLNCSNATWGSTRATIGLNAFVFPGTNAIGNPSNCGSPRQLLINTSPAFDSYYIAQQDADVVIGPKATVGLASLWAAREMGLSRSYRILTGAGGGGVLYPNVLSPGVSP